MSWILKVHTAVLVDIKDSMVYIAQDDPVSALRLRDAVRASFDYIKAFPRAGVYHHATLPQTIGLRKGLISGFSNHWLIYRIVDSREVHILRLVNVRQDLPSLFDF